MNALQEKLFLELRQTKVEIERSLKNPKKQAWLTSILQEELEDIQTAIKKLEDGNFGQCEFSGELISADLLALIPTLRSVKDSENLKCFYKKMLSDPRC